MSEVTIIGIDLAKRVFQLHGAPLQTLMSGVADVLLDLSLRQRARTGGATLSQSQPAAGLQKPFIEAPLVRAQWTAACSHSGSSLRESAC
jgi:hypothetical protein